MKLVLKIMLLFTGGMLVLGGGMCVVADAIFASYNSFFWRDLLIGAALGAAGFAIFWAGGAIKPRPGNSGESANENSAAASEKSRLGQ